MANDARIEVILRRSPIGGTRRQRETVKGLGLRRPGDRRVLPRTPDVLGMVRSVKHLVSVEESS